MDRAGEHLTPRWDGAWRGARVTRYQPGTRSHAEELFLPVVPVRYGRSSCIPLPTAQYAHRRSAREGCSYDRLSAWFRFRCNDRFTGLRGHLFETHGKDGFSPGADEQRSAKGIDQAPGRIDLTARGASGTGKSCDDRRAAVSNRRGLSRSVKHLKVTEFPTSHRIPGVSAPLRPCGDVGAVDRALPRSYR